MRLPRSVTVLGWVVLFACCPALLSAAEEPTPQDLWVDFNHYVRIARVDLAQSAIQALSNVPDQTLLEIVEATQEYRDWEKNTLPRALGNPTLHDGAKALADRIQKQRIAQVRQGTRIRDDIALLNQGARQRVAAIQRLSAAGQFAAPQLLETLLDEKQAALHPAVTTAMVAVGQPMVAPLCEALTELDPVPTQQVARVLTEIGYPQPLPHLKQLLERTDLSPQTQQVVQAAFERLASAAGVSSNTSAAELFLQHGQSLYAKGTSGVASELPGVDAASGMGVIWQYSKVAGLVPTSVPVEVFADVQAMRLAKRALALSPGLEPALSLWLGANCRRENRLPEGQKDASYPNEFQPAAFYLMAAGPLRQHDVLATALTDNDPALALDAIDALAATAGTAVLLNLEGTRQPLLAALSHTDRQVRWRAAAALTNARPTEAFPGSFNVVPVLCEPLRQAGKVRAVAIASDQGALNTLTAALSGLGYQVDGGVSLDAVMGLVNAGPGADLIVTTFDAANVKALYAQIQNVARLSGVPVLALAPASEATELNRVAREYPLLLVSQSPLDAIKEAADKALAMRRGGTVTDEASLAYALTSLRLLRDVAVGVSAEVYQVNDAVPSLLGAIMDSRDEVAAGAGQVLALVDSSDAQATLAAQAINDGRSAELRVKFLKNLATSARAYGDRVDAAVHARLLEQVKTAGGEVGLAAAEAHGALTLPVANVVELIKQ